MHVRAPIVLNHTYREKWILFYAQYTFLLSLTVSDKIKQELLHYIPRVHKSHMTRYFTGVPNIFITIVAAAFVHMKMFISSHASSRKCQITLTFTGHCRTWFMLPFCVLYFLENS
jgi:hypothetical protein